MLIEIKFERISSVALLAEGVDRNVIFIVIIHMLIVALLAEGVDRNTLTALKPSTAILSPSLRRAWIEIKHGDDRRGPESVALLAEGVDRNIIVGGDHVCEMQSPSLRRAWIEISCRVYTRPR